MFEIRAGPGGIGTPAELGLDEIHKAGLKAAEVEFVRQVYMDNKRAKEVGDYAKKLDIILSIHAPYYVNLNSEDKKILDASRSRILKSVERGHHMGASYVVFHPGYYGMMGKEETYQNVKAQVLMMMDEIRSNGWKTKIAAETMGKVNVFGNLDEVLNLVKETGCFFCMDFAHMIARNQGTIDYEEIFGKLKPFKQLHCHFSGIEWTDKGEKNHIVTPKKWMEELVGYLKKYKKEVVIINESPDPLNDSVKLMKLV
jgi:deoxyribonuclease-4